MSRGRTLTITLLTAAACGVLFSGCRQSTQVSKPAPVPEGKTPAAPTPAPETKPAAAKPVISLEAYYPLNPDHQYIIDYVKQIQKRHPKEITLAVYDMQSPEGRKAWMATGLSCAGVFVNGKTRWEIKKDGKIETVDFIKRLDSFWTREDFETVINQLLEQAKKQAK